MLLGTLLQGVGLGLAILEGVARLIHRESELRDQEIEDGDPVVPLSARINADFDDTPDEPEATGPLIPDTLDSMDLRRPQLGSHQTHANILMEQAAALGALRNGLMLSGFDSEEAWYLTRLYANLWWSSIYDREMDSSEDDD